VMARPRKSTTERGYGHGHQKERARWARKLKAAGQLACARCSLPVFAQWPLQPPAVHVPSCPQKPDCGGRCWSTWDLGHTDDRTAYTGPEHTCCNRAAGARARNRLARGQAAHPDPRPPRQAKDYGW